MALKKYRWNGYTYKIADEDLNMYPGAVPVEDAKKAEPKKKSGRPTKAELAAQLTNPELYEAVEAKKKAQGEPKNKARTPAKNKSTKKKEK